MFCLPWLRQVVKDHEHCPFVIVERAAAWKSPNAKGAHYGVSVNQFLAPLGTCQIRV